MCTLSVRLQNYQVKVAVDLHPRLTLQVPQVLGIKDIGILLTRIRLNEEKRKQRT